MNNGEKRSPLQKMRRNIRWTIIDRQRGLFGYLTDVFNVVPLHQEDGVEDEKLQMPEKLEISKNIITTLLRLKSLFLITRKALKTLGNCAGVPINRQSKRHCAIAR